MRAVAHDLKAPLLTVTSYLELIADGAFGEVSDEVRAALTRAAAVSERAQTVVASTLRPESIDRAAGVEDTRTRVDMNHSLSDVLVALHDSMRDRHATIDVQSRFPPVLTDSVPRFRLLEHILK